MGEKEISGAGRGNLEKSEELGSFARSLDPLFPAHDAYLELESERTNERTVGDWPG